MPTQRHILLTGARGMIGKYILRQLTDDGFSLTDCSQPSDNTTDTVTTLGLSELDNIRGDLRHAVPPVPAMTDTVIHCAGANPGNPNSVTEIRGLRNLLEGLGKCHVGGFVFLSSTDVYGKTEGTDITEDEDTEPVSEFGRMKLEAEHILTEWSAANGCRLCILRCAPVVGTGMEGPLRKLVNDIYRGSYRHIADNEARTSVVHATDVAAVAVATMGKSGIYNLTDGVNPTRHDLAEALSWRMGNKRILTIDGKKGRRLAKINDWLPFVRFNSEMIKEQTTTLTFSAEKIIADAGIRPHSVTEYLRTHNYDENSL